MNIGICLGGNKNISPFLQEEIKKMDLVIGADSGVELAYKLGVKPKFAVGDFDSISNEFREKMLDDKVEIRKYPTDKDFTDGEIAIKLGIELGADKIKLFGSWGNRMDHSIVNIMTMAKYAKMAQLEIVENDFRAYFSTGKINLKGKIGDTLSIIPLTPKVENVYTKGLQYSLAGESLEIHSSLGISNVLTRDEVEISHNEGILLVVHNFRI